MFQKGRKAKRSKKKKILSLIIVVAVTGTLGAVVYRKVRRPMAAATKTDNVQQTEVKKGSISNTITGTGNLELDDAEAVTIPSGLTIEDVLVENGDYVSAGTVLANVDSMSVQTAMDEIQSELKELDEKIHTCQEDEDENTVVSSVSGRVKAVYVEEGSDVTDIMTEKGALMELSLDGYMAVSIEKADSVSEGSSVLVTLSDGTVVDGTVASSEGSNMVITVTDNGTILGDEVSVSDSDGNLLGSGTLYIHQPFEVTAVGGCVSSVSVSENEAVSADDELLVLEGTESSAEYDKLLLVRQARTQTLQKLAQLAKTPQITAAQDGIVQDVNVAASGTTSADSSAQGSANANAAQMTYSGQTLSDLTFTQLSFDDGTTPIILEETAEDQNLAEDIPDSSQNQKITFAIAGNGNSTSTLLVVPTPVTGQTPVTEIAASDGTYSGVIVWKPADSVFVSGTEYQTLVVLSAADGYCFAGDSIQGIETGTVSGVHVSEDGKTLEFQIVFPSTAEDPSQDQNENENNPGQDPESTVTDGNDSQNTTTDSQDNGNEQSTAQNNSAQNNGNSQNPTAGSSQNTQSGQSTGGANGSSTGSSATGGTSASGENSSAKEDTSEDSTESASQYSTDVTAFTISPDENRLLSVSVDELDINSVELGQKAVVTFDAIEDQEFEGEVTKIGNTASVNGGVAKYTITITIPKDEKMKQGMNASATITIEEREDVLTLPMNALQEKGDRTFVYTEKDADGNLSGETEVTTGLSDGSTVEITDGLEEGTAVYYLRSENSSSDSGNTDMKMPDMGGNGMDSGAAPQMGGNGGGGDMGGGPGGGGGQGGPGK